MIPKTIIKKHINKRILTKSGKDVSRISTSFLILGIRLIDLKGLRTLKTLRTLNEGRFEAPTIATIKSNKLKMTIIKSDKFQ